MNKPSPLGSVCGEPNLCWVEPIKLSFVLSEGKEIVTQVPRHMRLIYHLPPTLFKDCCHSKASKDSVCAQHFPWTILYYIMYVSHIHVYETVYSVILYLLHIHSAQFIPEMAISHLLSITHEHSHHTTSDGADIMVLIFTHGLLALIH